MAFWQEVAYGMATWWMQEQEIRLWMHSNMYHACPPFYYVRKVVRELWLRIVWCQRPSVGHVLSNRRAPWSWSAAAEWCSHAPALHYPVTAQLPAPKTPQGDHWRSKLFEIAPQLWQLWFFVTIRTLIFSIHLIAKLIYIYIFIYL